MEFITALAELINGPIAKDYPSVKPEEVRLILLEAADSILSMMPDRLIDYANIRLRNKGVQVRQESMVSIISEGVVHLKEGDSISTKTVIWTAGVSATPLARFSNLDVNGKNQVNVDRTLQLPDAPGTYAVGDSAFVNDLEQPLPMVGPVAMQQGEAAANNILRNLKGEEPEAFQNRDRGMLAVLGRNSAIGKVGKFQLRGFLAWSIWALVHINGIIGFRNRVQVLVNWTSTYVFAERPVRLIIPSNFLRGSSRVSSNSAKRTNQITEEANPLEYANNIAKGANGEPIPSDTITSEN